MNEDKEKKNEKKLTEEIEVIDFSEDVKIENTLEKRRNNKRDNRIIIISLLLLISFVALLPTLTSLFNKDSNQNYGSTVDQNSSSNLINGFIQVDKTEGNMVINGIKFYNFIKRSDNIIRYNYKSENPVKNVESLSLFIEIYNKNEKVIYREQFLPSTTIDKGPVLSASLVLNPLIYQEAYYVKIVKIENENLPVNSSLFCTQEFVDDVYNVNYKVKYNFGNNALLNYEVTKNVSISQEANDTEGTYEKYNDLFLEEEANVSNTNTAKYKREDNYINYTIDLRTLDLKDSEYKILYEIGTVERTIKLIEESKGWSCSNE